MFPFQNNPFPNNFPNNPNNMQGMFGFPNMNVPMQGMNKGGAAWMNMYNLQSPNQKTLILAPPYIRSCLAYC